MPLPKPTVGSASTGCVLSTWLPDPRVGAGGRQAQGWVGAVQVALGHFIKFLCDSSRKRGPERGMTCPSSQGKPGAHTDLDLGLLGLLSRWASCMQTALLCLAPSRSRCRALLASCLGSLGGGCEAKGRVPHPPRCAGRAAGHALPLWCQAGASHL